MQQEQHLLYFTARAESTSKLDLRPETRIFFTPIGHIYPEDKYAQY